VELSCRAIFLSCGRSRTQLMRDSLGGAAALMTTNTSWLARTLVVAHVIALGMPLSFATPLTAQCRAIGTDNPCPGLKDSAAARSAVEQYFEALTRHEYDRAARLFVGSWQSEARSVYDSQPNTPTLAGFFRSICGSQLYVCDLRPRTVSVGRFRPPDTLDVVVRFNDRRGRLFTRVLLTVNSDSGYAVVSLPPRVP
jgi:hypothetical protein